MSNAFFGYQNRADESALSEGVWAATLPLNNLKDRVLSNVARSTNAVLASTKFKIAMTKARPIRVLGLINHNLSVPALVRFRAYDDAAYTTVAYDSGWIKVWDSIYQSTDLEWEADEYWMGIISEEDRAGYRWNVIHVTAQTIYKRYWLVEIDDTTNAAGYVQIGRLFISNGWTPRWNMSYGQSVQYESRDGIEEAYDGTEYFDERAKPRVQRFSLDHMPTDEAMAMALDMQRIAGVTKEVLFLYDPAEKIHFYRRSFLGRLRQLNPIEQAMYENHKNTFEIKELL